LSLGIRADPVFSLRIVELPMPTGSKDTGVLLDWLLDSMGLVRRSGGDESGALHRIVREAFLTEPLRGWNSKELGDQTGLSNTGIHHQMVKLRECGLVASQIDGKWHRYVLRGGSMAAAISLVESQAVAVLGLRASELAGMVETSETRMAIEAEEDETPFSISIAEPGPVESEGRTSALVSDLGLAGGNQRSGSDLARDILAQFCSSHQPITLLALSERLSESRGRVSTIVDRMRAAAIVERAPMVDRIPQDAFAGISRQFDARGEEWLMTRGGLGRLEEQVSKTLIEGARNGSLDIDGVREALAPVPLEDQRILLNTLGGRLAYGYRIAGADGDSVSKSVMRRAERTLRRLRTVAQRLDESL
jgi:DNA-binding transcriptional ArsR family regulator